MTDNELMELSESELINLIDEVKLKIEKLKLQNLKKRIIINQIINNN